MPKQEKMLPCHQKWGRLIVRLISVVGLIHLTLYDVASGQEVGMGTPFDDCTERAHRDFFHEQTTLSDGDESVKKRRLVLRTAMEEVGFTSYQYEWWHFVLAITMEQNRRATRCFWATFW